MLSRSTILVIHDDIAAQAVEQQHLESAGYRVRTATSAAEGLRQLAHEPVEVLLVGVGVPGSLNGLEFYAQAKAIGCAAPAILVGASIEDTHFVPALRHGIRDFVRRSPDYLHELTAAIERILRSDAEVPNPAVAARALYRSELQLQQVWDRSLDAMRLTDADGTILRINEAYCGLVRRTRAELEGTSFVLGYAEADRDAVLNRYRVHFAARTVESLACRLVTLWDGRKLHLEFSSSFLELAGEPLLLLSVIRDISMRVQLEEKLRQAQKMEAIGSLAGGIAHDFNNILTAIGGYSQLAYNGLTDAVPQRAFVAEVIKASERATNLTRQLLAFSRNQILEPQILDLNTVVRDMGGLLCRLIGEHIELTTVPTAGLWPVKVDPGSVEQVIVNLVVNARDAMPQGGKLTIETNNVRLDDFYAGTNPEVQPGPYVLLAVTDNGCGMDAETVARAFEPFFTTKGNRGTGLGLATVFGIVKQSGGSIGIYSEPQRGTTFKVYFPRAEGYATGQSAQATIIRPGSETLLLVEDDASLRGLSERILQSCGYHVLSASNGKEALKLASQYPSVIDLLVTDVVMPQMGGGELASELTQQRPEMKLLYLSGYTDDAVVRHGVLEEKVAFLHKPFTIAGLTRKVREVLEGASQRKNTAS